MRPVEDGREGSIQLAVGCVCMAAVGYVMIRWVQGLNPFYGVDEPTVRTIFGNVPLAVVEFFSMLATVIGGVVLGVIRLGGDLLAAFFGSGSSTGSAAPSWFEPSKPKPVADIKASIASQSGANVWVESAPDTLVRYQPTREEVIARAKQLLDAGNIEAVAKLVEPKP